MKDGRRLRIAAAGLMALIAITGLIHGLTPVGALGGDEGDPSSDASEPLETADAPDNPAVLPASG